MSSQGPQGDIDSVAKGDVGSFTITSIDSKPEYEFTADIGYSPPLVVDGYGGWTVQSTPKDIGLTIWEGRQPIAIEIPFILDNWRRLRGNPGTEVEKMVVQLNRLCGLGRSGQPPKCKVDSAGLIPHDFHGDAGIDWVIENLSWDADLEIRNPGGNRVRCGGTITIRQHVDHEVLDKLKVTAHHKPKHRTSYRVRAGDTLSKIAKRKDIYGNAAKWRKIADANHIRDPHAKLKVGRRLRIP